MIDGEPPQTLTLKHAASRNWFAKYWVIVFAVVFFSVYTAPFIKNYRDKTWTKLFAVSARHMLAGEHIHRGDEGDVYVYPPTVALYSIPLAVLPKVPSLIGWYLLNIAAAALAFTSAWKLAGGPSLLGLRGQWVAVFCLGLLIAGRFFLSPLENHQYDMVIAAMLLSGCLLLFRGRDLRGAALLGAAAALKCTPWLFGPYLLWRGKIKAACMFGVVAIGLNIVPDAVFPQKGGSSYLGDWYFTTLSPAGRSAPGQWVHGGAEQSLNQSLGGLVHRYVTFGMSSAEETVSNRFRAIKVSAENARWRRFGIYGIALTLLLVTAYAYGRPLKGWPVVAASEPCPLPLQQLRLGVECSGVLCLMLLFSPMSSKAHYAVMLLPAILLARCAIQLHQRWLFALLAGMAVTGPLSVKGLLGKKIGDMALMWGFPTWYVLVALAAVWGLSWKIERSIRSESQPPKSGEFSAELRSAA